MARTTSATGDQRSSMDSFLDEYQLLRLAFSGGGWVLLVASLLIGITTPAMIPIAVVLTLVAAHASWCTLRGIRQPRTMLAMDLTLWGSVMVWTADETAVITATLAFLSLLVVLFGDGYWTVGFLAYLSGWFGFAYFSDAGVTTDSVATFASTVFTVGALAVVMSRVRRWLARLDANRSQMLGTVSHELRNNLTGMMGITDLIAEDPELGEGDLRELVGLARQQAVDATEIVEDLLTATRLERSALTVAVEAVDLNTEVETTARRFRGEGTEVSLHLASHLPPAVADSLRVRQVLRNLVSNAVRYGGSRIELKTSFEGGRVVVVVADDGDGVPVDDEATIFLPYSRSAGTRRNASSVGLGLWICRHLASAMDGSLEYRRIDGVTQFVFILPTETAAKAVASRKGVLNPSGIPSAGNRGGVLPALSL